MLERLMVDKIVTVGGKEYKLRKVTKQELFNLRLGKEPGLVFKYDKELWFTELPNSNIRFRETEGKKLQHLCSSDYECCSRLSALPDPEGCACVRDESFTAHRRNSKHRVHLCNISLRIEKYDFLVYAIETFNMKEDCLKVLSCKNCCRSRVKPSQMDIEEREKKIVALAQHLDPYVEKVSDLKRFNEPQV